MLRKKILLLIPCLLTIIWMGCKEDSEVNQSIVGSWKCVGFGDTKTNNVKEIELKDCEECYTMTFKEDGTFSGRSILNILSGEYEIFDKELIFTSFFLTEIGEINGNGSKFTDVFTIKIFQCEIKKLTLKLFYSETEFLLFNRLK
ncbi:MAG: hypothetical protein BGO29_03450 [Bacteroidales bacterium 36-12]|nr:MAG: hypothetical protein BGO29_03450 [Bacteroidales bacterium 36-12]